MAARLHAHAAGSVLGYTSTRRPVRLVWSQESGSREEALAAERRIKGWSRAKKEALILGDWERLSALGRSRNPRSE
jgi:predicted GIY-YIG superfamily endonuclease